jgi:hypothetical protein
MAINSSTGEGGWPPPGLEDALRVEQRGDIFVVVNDKGEKVFYAITRHAAEEARAYWWTCMAAGREPEWFRPRRAIDPATGKPLPTIGEELAALKERVEKPAVVLGRMEKKPRNIPWQDDEAAAIVDSNPDMKKAPLARKVRKNLEARGVKDVPEDDRAIVTFITNRRKIISDA